MLKIENTEVLGWEHAIRGMRNPMHRRACYGKEQTQSRTLPMRSQTLR